MLQACSGRSGMQQQEQNSPNLTDTFFAQPCIKEVFIYLKSEHGEWGLHAPGVRPLVGVHRAEEGLEDHLTLATTGGEFNSLVSD